MPASFRGDLAWVHAREGHNGRPYWPKGASGITIDPGIDLGQADPDLIREVLTGRLPEEQIARLLAVRKFRGDAAARKAREMRDITISRELAAELMPLVAAPYWIAILARFPGLAVAPPPAHTAMLSLAYNRGPNNKHLAPLASPIANGDWRLVGAIIKAMQQEHPLKGIRERRVLEGNLILQSGERHA